MNRRKAVAAIGGVIATSRTHAAKPERMKPQVGDTLVHAFGERSGTVVRPDEVTSELLFAFARSEEGIVRDGSLHNQVSVLRVSAETMTSKTERYAAGGLVAVSAACTHTGCEVSVWHHGSAELECPCHGSKFAILDGARVVNGPATKALAFLPIELADGVIKVAGKFSRRVGPAPTF